MKNVITTTLLTTILATTGLYAGAGHHHGPDGSHMLKQQINERQAVAAAKKQIKQYVKDGKLENSWLNAETGEVTRKKFYTGLEWVVGFDNPAAADKAKQQLFIFIGPIGEPRGANHTGN